jgi:hypothetical protein
MDPCCSIHLHESPLRCDKFKCAPKSSSIVPSKMEMPHFIDSIDVERAQEIVRTLETTKERLNDYKYTVRVNVLFALFFINPTAFVIFITRDNDPDAIFKEAINEILLRDWDGIEEHEKYCSEIELIRNKYPEDEMSKYLCYFDVDAEVVHGEYDCIMRLRRYSSLNTFIRTWFECFHYVPVFSEYD